MRFVNFHDPRLDTISVGVLWHGKVLSLRELLGWEGYPEVSDEYAADTDLGSTPGAEMVDAIDERSVVQLPAWRDALQKLPQDRLELVQAFPLDELTLYPPIFPPASLRDFYAFEQHVRAAWSRRGAEVPAEWYQLPVFYFSNHQAILGPDDELRAPTHGQWLDFELEVAAVIGLECRDTTPDMADEVIAGYTIMNDWSLRDVQRIEVRCGLGPAKAKDFATSLGPYLVTPHQLDKYSAGKGYDLKMLARVNGRPVSAGNWKDLYWSFGEMLARASQGTTLYPGDVIGSGTVGSGCLLELGTHLADGTPVGSGVDGWLGPGDSVELEIEQLGVLRNTIVAIDIESQY